MASKTRLLLVVLCVGAGYLAVQRPEVRALYSAEDKWAHAAAFFVVWWALRWATGWKPGVLALVGAVLGGTVEVHQVFMPGFYPSWADWAADLMGVGLAYGLLALGRRSLAPALN